MNDQDTKLKLLQVKVSSELHRLLRVDAANRGVSVRALVQSILVKAMKGEEK